MKYIVYCHTLKKDNRKYIGITSIKPALRWRKKGQGYKENSYFYRAIQKYGWDNFEHEILFENLTEEQAKEKEIELIEKYKTQDHRYGFNLTGGGESGYKPCEITREKQRKSAMGNKSHLGHKHTEEMKENMRKLKLEFYSHKENREKISRAANPQKKKVAQIDKETNKIIKIYSSLTEAAEQYGSKANIGHCCKNEKYITAYGYKWQYV